MKKKSKKNTKEKEKVITILPGQSTNKAEKPDSDKKKIKDETE